MHYSEVIQKLVLSIYTWKQEELEIHVQFQGCNVMGPMGNQHMWVKQSPLWAQAIWKRCAIKGEVVLSGKAWIGCTELQRQMRVRSVKIRPRSDGTNFSTIISTTCCKLPEVGLGSHQELQQGSCRWCLAFVRGHPHILILRVWHGFVQQTKKFPNCVGDNFLMKMLEGVSRSNALLV